MHGVLKSTKSAKKHLKYLISIFFREIVQFDEDATKCLPLKNLLFFEKISNVTEHLKLHFFFNFRALYIEAYYPFIPIPINYIRPSKVIDVVICHSQMEAESWISCHRMRIDQRMNDSTYKINTEKKYKHYIIF